MRDFIFEACLFGDLYIVPNSFRFLAMGGKLGFAELRFGLDVRLDFGGAFSLQAFQLREPARVGLRPFRGRIAADFVRTEGKWAAAERQVEVRIVRIQLVAVREYSIVRTTGGAFLFEV